MGIHLGLRWWIFDPNPALRVQVRTSSELVRGLFASAGRIFIQQGFQAKVHYTRQHSVEGNCKVFEKWTEDKYTAALVEPHNHRANTAKQAIQTFKNHMIAGFCTFDSNFLLEVMWNKTIRQGQDTLNMLRTVRTHQKILAYHALEGVHDFN